MAYEIKFKSASGDTAATISVFSSAELTTVMLEGYTLPRVHTCITYKRNIISKLLHKFDVMIWSLPATTPKEDYRCRIHSVIKNYTEVAKVAVEKLNAWEERNTRKKTITEEQNKDHDIFMKKYMSQMYVEEGGSIETTEPEGCNCDPRR